jgi:hypothetical protein
MYPSSIKPMNRSVCELQLFPIHLIKLSASIKIFYAYFYCYDAFNQCWRCHGMNGEWCYDVKESELNWSFSETCAYEFADEKHKIC